MPTIDGMEIRLGRLKAPRERKMLQAELYLTAANLPPPKPSDWTKQISSWPMMGNNQFGDCVEACWGHAIMVASQYGDGSLVTPSDQEIVTTYLKQTGGRDIGLNMPDALDYWDANALSGQDIDAWGKLNVRDTKMIAITCQLFGPVPIGIELPNNFEQGVNSGQWSDTGLPPNPQLGHCVLIAAVNSTGPIVVTWGRLVQMTWAWFLKYTEEAYLVLYTAWRGKLNPSQLDFNAFVADYQAITGRPAPPIQPPPGPPGPPAPPNPPQPPAPPIIGDSVGLDVIIRLQQGQTYHSTINVPRAS